MRKNLEKRLIWVVATTLSLNGAPFMPAAQAQLSPATTDSNNQMMEKPASETVEYAQGAENKPSSVPGTTLYRDYPGDEGALNTATEDEPSELPMKTLKQLKADTVVEETKEPAAESSPEKPAESEDKVKRLIEAGFEKTFGDVEVEILEKKIEIAGGMTPEMMESGGVPRNEEPVVPFLVTFADGRVQKGEAQPIVVGPGGEISIAGVHMFNGPADEDYPGSNRDGDINNEDREIFKNELGIVPHPTTPGPNSNPDGEINNEDREILKNELGIIPNPMPPAETGEKPAEPQSPFSIDNFPAGPMTPYTTPGTGNIQSSPDYTPLVVPSDESLIVPEDDSLYSSKKDISRDRAQEKSFAALPESEPIENVPQDNGMMTLEEARKRKDGTIKDIDPKNPSQSPCGGGTQIQSPGGVGPTAWFCPGSNAPESTGPATADFTPVEETVMSTETIPEPLKPETAIETADESKPLLNQDGSVWAKPVVFKNPSVEVAADEPSLEIRSLTPSLNQKEEEVVRITLNTPVVASFVRAVQSFQREYKPRSDTLSELRTEIKAAYRDLKAIVSEEAEKRIEEAKAEAENKVQDVRAAFDNQKESARNSALPERNEGRAAGQSKKEKREALRESIVLIKRKADARIAEFSNLYQSADKQIKEYKQAYTAGTPFPAMAAPQNSTVFTAENGESLLG